MIEVVIKGALLVSLAQHEVKWYIDKIKEYDPQSRLVNFDENEQIIIYTTELKTDENICKQIGPEELVHALVICILCSDKYKYKIGNLYHEQYFRHGSSGSLSDEVDIMIYDEDNLPYALIELKSAEKFNSEEESAIQYQLFGTAPLTNGPKYLVYATVEPMKENVELKVKCIDYTKYKSYESWVDDDKPTINSVPIDYQDNNYEPYVSGNEYDLKSDCTQADFRAVASGFHNEFFGEHPDNSLFINLVKCLLAKIYDERTIKKGEKYRFQVLYRNGKPENADQVFDNINTLYKEAYLRYIDQSAAVPDEIDPKEFSKDKVKSVVQALQAMSITKGAALHGDIIGAFFEEILRVGFKQDKGMYFTHSNIVRFMIEAIGLPGLTRKTWLDSNHPDNRLPYVIDPACGSGSFLLHSMQVITNTIRSNRNSLVNDFESEQFYNARMSDTVPNYWAENFIYGFDPKFIMAITAKVNMVLHGDGSAHIFKYDAYKPFSKYSDLKLRIISEENRSVDINSYPHELCETFDVVLSNPPFGVTLAPDTKKSLKKTFSLQDTLPSDGLFLERCFQLLKPGGRLGLVLPESIFNAVDLLPVRMLLYRFFKIKAVVSLPRNVFIDTPTLTSLLFAQKKTAVEIKEWDSKWKLNFEYANKKIKKAKNLLSSKSISSFNSGLELSESIIRELDPVIKRDEWIIKKGKNAEIMLVKPAVENMSIDEIKLHYEAILKSSSIEKFINRYVFEKTTEVLNYDFVACSVNEVGFKLSKRKERVKPNQLCTFVGVNSGDIIQNLHLCNEPFMVKVNTEEPKSILDYLVKELEW